MDGTACNFDLYEVQSDGGGQFGGRSGRGFITRQSAFGTLLYLCMCDDLHALSWDSVKKCRNGDFMKRAYKLFWIILIVLIPLIPLSGWNFSIDVSDVGFNMNQYRFCFTDMESTYLPLFLTNILGGCLLKLFAI